MKKQLPFFFLLFCLKVSAQEPQSSYDSVFRPIIPTDKAKLLKNVDVIFNMRFASDNNFYNGKFQESEFRNNQLRLEIKGKITDKVYFRFRDRYTSTPESQSKDNIVRSVDLAYIGIELSSKIDLYLGKLCAAWGGYEFDMNPIDVLEYNDITNNSNNFLTGVGVSNEIIEGQTVTLQVLNARNASFSEVYEGKMPLDVEPSKVPFAYVVNWNGKFFGGKFQTLYSYSYFNEAKRRGMNYYSFGNMYKTNNVKIMYDFNYSNEGIDRKGIITSMLPDTGELHTQQNVSYLENWIRADIKIIPKLAMSLTLMTSNAYAKNVVGPNSGKDHIRTSYGYIPMIEYMPFKNQNMRFFAAYAGRNFNYSSFAKENWNQSNFNTGRISIGFIAPLLVL